MHDGFSNKKMMSSRNILSDRYTVIFLSKCNVISLRMATVESDNESDVFYYLFRFPPLLLFLFFLQIFLKLSDGGNPFSICRP